MFLSLKKKKRKEKESKCVLVSIQMHECLPVKTIFISYYFPPCIVSVHLRVSISCCQCSVGHSVWCLRLYIHGWTRMVMECTDISYMITRVNFKSKYVILLKDFTFWHQVSAKKIHLLNLSTCVYAIPMITTFMKTQTE